MKLFDEQRLDNMRKHAYEKASVPFFLWEAVQKEVVERLKFCDTHNHRVLISGLYSQLIVDYLKTHFELIQLDTLYSQDVFIHSHHNLPYYSQSFDLIIDCLQFHTLNNPAYRMKEYQRLLKKDGYLFIIFCGGQTLCELRETLLQTEIIESQGASLRVIPMIELPTFVSLAQSIQHKNIITDHEMITIYYQNFMDILNDIKSIGEHQPFQDPPRPLTFKQWQRAAHLYRKQYCDSITQKLKVTVEMIYHRFQNIR